MSIRLTGMVSGFDTDSLVQQMVNVQKVRNKKVEDKKVTLEWKQDIWKTLNTKLYSFYREQASRVRLQSSYKTKSAVASNDKSLEVRANGDAPLGSHKLKIEQLASSQYITGGRVESNKSGESIDLSNNTKLSDLVDLSQINSATINIGGKELAIDSETTIADVITTARDAGLNANFDSVQKRFFISSKNSGQANAFEISENVESPEGSISILGALQLDEVQIGEDGKMLQAGDRSTLVKAQDSIVIYNGAQLISDSNTINANGLTFTLIEANPGDEISINVSNDSQATYDMIKDFVNGYNEILLEMNTRYNASSAGSYAPLTDEEKQAMPDKTVEDWETKIQDSLLRRDSTLDSLISSFRQIMNKQVEVDGKSYSLSNFGIRTGDYSERGLLHIHGDKDNPTYGSEEDMLLSAIEEDPDLVMKVFSEIGRELYSNMGDRMSSIPNVRSAMTFYNDRLMSKELTRYEKDIANLEKKLFAMEERYYNQFARLETALAQLNSQSNYLYSMMGMGQ